MQRRKHIAQAYLTKDQLENLYALIDSIDELARDIPSRALSADARYLLADIRNELEDAMIERGFPLITADQLADHIPMVYIAPNEDEDDDTTLAAMYNDDGLLTLSDDIWGNFADRLFDESAPPADDEDNPSEAATS